MVITISFDICTARALFGPFCRLGFLDAKKGGLERVLARTRKGNKIELTKKVDGYEETLREAQDKIDH